MLQFRRIGASLDYRRERFTMDDAYVRAVMRFFVHLWDKGWIYRANRIGNWCPYHLTSLSDLELAHEDVDDALTYVRYPFADGDGHITIATVRPGDDPRRRRGGGSSRRRALPRLRSAARSSCPWVERRVPVIADERVEREFGTGALKITPAHDPTDYEIGLDHGLPELTVIGPDGRMNDEAGELAGLTQDEAEERVLAWLRERDQIEKRESYRHTRRALRPLQDADRAADLAAVVVLDGGAEEARAGGAALGQGALPSRSRSIASRSPRSRKRPTGTSRGRSGGGTSCRSGSAPTAT